MRQVQLQRGATRFCPNMEEHCHYYCDKCGAVFDVSLPTDASSMPRPKGFKVDHYDIAVHGLCSKWIITSDEPTNDGGAVSRFSFASPLA